MHVYKEKDTLFWSSPSLEYDIIMSVLFYKLSGDLLRQNPWSVFLRLDGIVCKNVNSIKSIDIKRQPEFLKLR